MSIFVMISFQSRFWENNEIIRYRYMCQQQIKMFVEQQTLALYVKFQLNAISISTQTFFLSFFHVTYTESVLNQFWCILKKDF